MTTDDDRVRRQYEELPYPERIPDDERRRLLSTPIDSLELINHFGYRGARDFTAGFRVLVAGGGTGDATIFLAEQLADSDATVVHLDVSQASMDVARARARIRGLDGIEWVHGSLLDLDPAVHGAFDYVNCVGVLHHLDDPLAGLRALEGVLAPGGVLGLMVYGRYGRAAVYQVQELLRRVHGVDAPVDEKLAHARAVLDALPDHHWFNLAGERHRGEVERGGDAALYDLLLHSRDRAFTVDELYALLDGAGLPQARFVTLPDAGVDYYDPAALLPEGPLLERIRAHPSREQTAIAELLFGGISMHVLYATREPDTACSLDDLDLVPFVHSMDAYEDWYATLREIVAGARVGAGVRMTFASGPVTLPIREHTRAFFGLFDGRRPLREIYAGIRRQRRRKKGGPSVAALHAELRPLLDALHRARFLLLRTADARLPARLASLAGQLLPG